MDEVESLWRGRRTCLEMLRDRGYLVDKNDIELSRDDFLRRFGLEPDPTAVPRSSLVIVAEMQEDPTRQVLVTWFDEPRVGVKPVKAVAQRMRDEGIRHAILVVQDSVTPFAKQCIGEMGPRLRLEVFCEAELRVNITTHSMVPAHSVLTAQEKQTLLVRYKIKDTQLPRISAADPVARYFGQTRGQVVRIVRGSETAGRYVTYRLCV